MPGPKLRFMLGSFHFIDPLIHSSNLKEQMKGVKTFKERNFFFPWITTYDSDIIKEILISRNLPKAEIYDEIEIWWGKGNLVTSPHDLARGNWKMHRQLLNPAFKTSSVRKIRSFFEKHTELLVKIIEEKNGDTFDFKDLVQKSTLDIIADTGFSYDLGAIYNKQGDFFEAINAQITLLGSPWVLLPGGGTVVKFLNYKTRKVVDNLFDDVINQKLAQKRTEETSKDLLDLMLLSEEYANDKETLKSDLFTFFVAGHETTATALSWTIYELAKNPEIQEEAFHEVDSALHGTFPKESDDLMTMLPFLVNCINESLRLYPPAAGVSRTVREDTEIKGLTFPKGVTISCNFFLLHRDPDVWEDPLSYKPSRFFQKSLAKGGCDFVAFSAGPRICLGKNFSYEEGLTILYRLLQKFKIVLADDSSGKVDGTTGITKPNKVNVKFLPRSS